MKDLFKDLLKQRIIFIDELDYKNEAAKLIIAQTLFLESEDPDKDIFYYINSPGGSLNSFFAIYDVMQFVKPDIVTLAIGEASSAGSFVLAAGAKNKRFALKNTRVMIHQPSGDISGQTSDIVIYAEEVLKVGHKLATILAKQTGQSIDVIKKSLDRDNYMSAEEAQKFGLIDKVITFKSDIKLSDNLI